MSPETGALVLLVDDSATQGQQWTQTLRAAGFRVFLAMNGREALEQARRSPPDVIVSDVLMPVMDGFALCREIRRDTDLQQIPLELHTTSYLDPRDQEFALGLGATRFVLKPKHPEQLLAEVRLLLDLGHAPRSPSTQVDDRTFLQAYSERLAAKLEDKVAELELAYVQLEQQTQQKLRQARIDIARHRRAEGVIRQSEARQLAILATALDAIVTIDHEGKILEFNPAAERTFGYRRDAVVGELAETIIPMHGREDHPGWVMRGLVDGDGLVLNQRLLLAARRADGTEFPVEATIARMPTAGPPLLTAFIRDISERVASEATQRHLAAIVGSSNDAIVGMTLDGIITSWNPAAHRLYGYTADEMIAQPISTLSPADRLDEIEAILARLQDGVRLEHHETLQLTSDGRTLDVSLSAWPLEDADGRVVGSATIARDISGQKRAEAQIKALNLDLEKRVVERTSQLEAAILELEAFSYSVSHDLRAPLRAMNGFSHILQAEHANDLPPEGQVLLQRVLDAAKRMGHLIDDLLAFSRLGRQALEKQHVLPADVLQRAQTDLAIEHEGRSIEVVVGELPACEADPALLRQVYVNLLGNALKFTRGRVVAHIEIGSHRTGGEVVYFVKDDGAGFDMRYAHKLFGVFQRLHRAEDFAGTGVGLAIVQRIVNRHGGRVWATAEPDRGATFYFTLRSK